MTRADLLIAALLLASVAVAVWTDAHPDEGRTLKASCCR